MICICAGLPGHGPEQPLAPGAGLVVIAGVEQGVAG